jgi:DNA polymerase-3 subunit gamma/tau
MSYLAIARKYRPATFDEIVGQEHVTRTLKNAIARNRIHHAYLFSGARGVGKTTAARALARALNCVNGPTPNPCGVCPSCLEVGNGNSPDLIEIDGASNNSVDDIRDLRETVKYAPNRGKWRIYLIDEVHMLSKGAFNALLKTLEEPPPYVIFIFATTEANRIPETILSRVQRFDFRRIPATSVSERLRDIAAREGVVLTDAGLRLIARAGDGSMRDAQSLLDQVISYGAGDGPARAISDVEVVEALGLIDRGLLYDMLAGLVGGAPDRCLAVIDHVYGHGWEISDFTAEMLEILRNATFARLSPGSRKYIDAAAEELERLDTITKDVDPEVLARAFAAMLDVHDQVSRAPRPRVVLEMAVARLASTRPVQPVGALLGRLEDLERRLRTGGASPTTTGMRSTPRSPRSPGAGAGKAADDEGAPAATPPALVVARPPEAPKPPLASVAPPPTAAAPAPNREPSEPASPWVAFREQLLALDPPAAVLVEVEPTRVHDRLRIVLPPRALAEAKRHERRPEVAAALRRCYGDDVRLDLVAPTETEARREEDFTAEVKRDPAVKRIIDRLDATVGKIKRLS